MRFSIWPSLSQPWSGVLDVVRHAESSGWDGVYVADHFMGSGGELGPDTTPNPEETAAVAELASAHKQLRRGTPLLGNTSRHPAGVVRRARTDVPTHTGLPLIRCQNLRTSSRCKH